MRSMTGLMKADMLTAGPVKVNIPGGKPVGIGSLYGL